MRNIYLDPNSEPGQPAAPANPAEPIAPSYLPAETFSSFQNEFNEFRDEIRGHFSSQRQAEPVDPVQHGNQPLREPSMEDSKYSKDAAGFQSFLRDYVKYQSSAERAELETQSTQAEQMQAIEDRIASAKDAHFERVAAIPDFSQRMRGAQIGIKDNTALGLAILESDYSAQVLLHLRENPQFLNDLKKTLRDNGAEAAIRRIGRLENKFETEKANVTSKTNTARNAPTRAGFPGGNGASSGKLSVAELRAKYA